MRERASLTMAGRVFLNNLALSSAEQNSEQNRCKLIKFHRFCNNIKKDWMNTKLQLILRREEKRRPYVMGCKKGLPLLKHRNPVWAFVGQFA